MGAFFEYLAGLWQHWTWFITGGPFLLERVTKQFWTGYEPQASRLISPRVRFRIGAGAGIAGMFVASFLAFSDERQLYTTAQTHLDQASDKRERVYPVPTHDEIARLTAALEPLVLPREWVGIAFVDNPSSVRMAEAFGRIILAVGGTVTVQASAEDDPNGSGIQVQIRHPDHPNDHDRRLLEAFRLANMPVSAHDLESNGPMESTVRFEIFVSYPPL